MSPPPTDPPLYHITHVDNLPGILAEGGLWSDAQRIARGLKTTGIGYGHIKVRRLTRPVSVKAGGNVGDHVPFYFCPRSEMLFVIFKGNSDDLQYRGGQQPILHLVSSVKQVIAHARFFAFTERHADLAYAKASDHLADLAKIDWAVMPVRQWGGDQDVKEKRLAEFLVRDFLPWSAILEIGVHDSTIQSQVAEILRNEKHAPPVHVRNGANGWYY